MIDWQAKVISPNVSKFGQSAIYIHNKKSFELMGIFDSAYTDVDVVDGLPVTTLKSCFGFNVSDLPVEAQQSAFLLVKAALGEPLQDTTYRIKEVRLDGHGWVRLMLNRK